MTSGDLLERLAARHAKDVFVAECNLGSAHAGCRRLDGWAMRKSWSPFTTIGYEVKVARSDFLRDNKWEAYLPVCHELYFVCPRKLIDPRELPDGVGLLWTLGAERLQVKRKAPRRTPDPKALVRLMAYVLMSRTQIVADMWAADAEAPVDRWRRWLLEEDGERHIGHMVGRRLAQRLEKAENARRAAESRAGGYERIEQRLRELGLDPAQPLAVADLHARLDGDEHLRALRLVARLTEQAADIARRAAE